MSIEQQRRLEIVLRRRSERAPIKDIASELGVTRKTIWKDLKSLKQGAMPLDRAATVLGVSRKELREQQKQILMERFRGHTEEICDFLLECVNQKDAKGFALVMQGLEKMDRVAGNTVGEGQKLEVSGANGGPIQVDARMLIARITEHLKTHAP